MTHNTVEIFNFPENDAVQYSRILFNSSTITDSRNNTQLMPNSLDDAKTTQGADATSEIEPIRESEDDIERKSETLSKTLCDNTSTVKRVSTININIDKYKSSANSEIELSLESDYDENCKALKCKTLFETISKNKQNICKILTLGFLLSVVSCLIYYFASLNFKLVVESTPALKTSTQENGLHRKPLITANIYLSNTTTSKLNEYRGILLNTASLSTIVTTVTTPLTFSTFKVGHRLHVTNGDHGGRWNSDIYCQPGTYACGFRLKVEKDGGTFYDDAGLTNMQLYCKNSELSTNSFIESSVLDYNTNRNWRADTFCTKNYYLVAFQLGVDPRQWFKSDHTAITNINFVCRGPGLNGLQTYNILGNGMMHWGKWGTFSELCEIGTAICGMQTKAQTVPDYDKLGMTDLKLLCCQNY